MGVPDVLTKEDRLTPEEFIARRAGAEARRAEAQRAFEARCFYVKVMHPKYGPADVETWADDRDAAVEQVRRRFPDEPIIEVADRAHHTDYCTMPKYAAEHASWLR